MSLNSLIARSRSDRGKSRGFTLIEVLVVVAIIALLIAILLPSLARARWHAKVVACKAHEHDLATAFSIYAETYRGYYPVTPNGIKDTYWSLYKANLLKDTNLLVCPASKNRIRVSSIQNVHLTYDASPEGGLIQSGDSDIDHVAPMGRDDSSGGHSYEYNGVFGQNTANYHSSFAERHKRNVYFRVAFYNLMLVHENDEDIYGPAGCDGSGNNCPQPWDNHGSEGMNIMFADSHVDFIPRKTGTIVDRTFDPPYIQQNQVNAVIEMIWLKSNYPWCYW